MKGLLVKDLLLLKNQKKLILIILIFAVLYPVMGMEEFTLYMMGIMGLIAASSTLSYDEFENGDCFLFTLPFTRKEYVAEKYLLCLCGIFVGLILGVASNLIISQVQGGAVEMEEILMLSLGAFLVFGGATAFMLPVYFRFGVEKGRLPAYIVMFAIFAASSRILGEIQSSYPEMGLTLPPKQVMFLGIFVIVSVLVLLSMAVSFRIMEKKEF